MQDVFVKLWQQSSQFETLSCSALDWIFSIAKQHAHDVIRQQTSETSLEARYLAQDQAPIEMMWQQGELDGFLAGVESLTLAEQEFMALAYLTGSSQQEIAQFTGAPLVSVKSGLRRGIRKLRAGLERRASSAEISGGDSD